MAARTVSRLVAFAEEPHHRPQRPPPQSTLPPRRNAATGGRGLDFAFDCAGVPIVREQAASVLGLNGSLILVGITPQPLTISGLTFNHLSKQVRGHYGGFPASVSELVWLTAAGRLDLAPSLTTSRSPRSPTPPTPPTGRRTRSPTSIRPLTPEHKVQRSHLGQG
ncbi:zinc-binding dehydrogenase [Streptomyces mirabilis]|uniref:zinc-binding dehydrogenase n=1 Tax=Streptomyces mirabilis TaxID=68239 RepID=UPI0036BFAB42